MALLHRLLLFFVRVWAPLAWASPGRTMRRLHAFALAEHGSQMMLRTAALRTRDPERKAHYLRGALDEGRHTRLFLDQTSRLARELGRVAPPPPRDAEDSLFDALGEARFLAFLHHGERRAEQQFRIHRDHALLRGHGELAACFEQVLEDEAGHEGRAFELLCAMLGSERCAHREIAAARRWEILFALRRSLRRQFDRLFVLGLWLVYPLLLPQALIARWLAAPKTEWPASERDAAA